MKKLTKIFLSMLIASMVACSPSVYTDRAEGVNFTEYETYAYLPSGNREEGSGTRYTEMIINEVNQEMQARGYRLDNQNPDLLVNVSTMYREEEELLRTPVAGTYEYYTTGFYTPTTLEPYYYTGYNTIPQITGVGIREVEYTEGTFVVDVIDATNNKIVWRGWSETPVDPSELDESVKEYVDNIFEEYPVEVED